MGKHEYVVVLVILSMLVTHTHRRRVSTDTEIRVLFPHHAATPEPTVPGLHAHIADEDLRGEITFT